MLTLGTEIQVGQDSSLQRVDDLMIGQMVYNHFTRSYDEIIDILIREVKISGGSHPWTPIEIPTNRLGENRPYKNLLVSPQQEILTTLNASKGNFREIGNVGASELGFKTKEILREITYCALFFERPRAVVAHGVLCLGMTNDVYDQ